MCTSFTFHHTSINHQTAKHVSSSSGDGSYPYAAQQLGLGAEGTETTNKFGENMRLCERWSVIDRVQAMEKVRTNIGNPGK